MDEHRLLLPFVEKINIEAIDHVLRFSKAGEFSVVALALIVQHGKENIRPELTEQANDFLETAKARAEIQHICIECHQYMTQNVTDTILNALTQFQCEGVIFPYQEKTPCFLNQNNIISIRQQNTTKIYLLSLPPKKKIRLFCWEKAAL